MRECGKSLLSRAENVFVKKNVQRTSFYTILLVMAALTIRDLYDLVEEYRDENKKAKIGIIFNDTMTFPNMTFCMSRPQAWSHFNMSAASNLSEWNSIINENLKKLKDKEAFLHQRWDFRMVLEAYQVVMSLNSLERETSEEGALNSITGYRLSPRLAGSRKLINFWLDEIGKRNVTFAEFQQKTGFETLKRSVERFQRLSYDENEIFRSRIRIMWLSQRQLCFQPEFDQDNFKDIVEQGDFFTLQVSHNSENFHDQTADCMTLDVHGRPTDLARYLQGKGRMNDGLVGELCLGMRYEVEVEVKAKYISLEDLEADDGTACRNYSPDDDDEFNCHSRCRKNYLQTVCNCTPLTLEYLTEENALDKFPPCKYEKCIIDLDNSNTTEPAAQAHRECKKKCIAGCEQIRYSITPYNKGASSRPDLTEITVFWMSFEYMQMEQELVYTLITFFPALGGAMGLWLGLSILSLIQFLIFLSARCSKRVAEKAQKQRQEDAYQMHNNNESYNNSNDHMLTTTKSFDDKVK